MAVEVALVVPLLLVQALRVVLEVMVVLVLVPAAVAGALQHFSQVIFQEQLLGVLVALEVLARLLVLVAAVAAVVAMVPLST